MPLLANALTVRRWQSAGLTLLIAAAAGCPLRDLPPPNHDVPEIESAETATEAAEAPAALVATPASGGAADAHRDVVHWVGEVLRANRENRSLSTDINAAWQIMHGVLAYGRELTITTSAGPQPAVEYLLGGGAARGFELSGGEWFDIDPDQDASPQRVRGVVAPLDPGSKVGQGHRDQWLAYMARCGFHGDDQVVTRDGPLTIDGWIRQIQWDVPRNFEQEYSWTLTALVAHRPTTDHWVARDGRQYSIESLLQSELHQLSPSSACGGSHRLCAIANALNRHRQDGHPITGVWAEAERWVQLAIAQSKEFQNTDGSFSSNYFERPGWSLDLSAALGTTGHVFEFIAVAASDHELQRPWVQNAARFLCRTLEQTAELDLECGALYHALSGLAIYHERASELDQTVAADRL